MGIFDFLRGPDINAGVKEFAATADAVLLDVRTSEEYREGHIPGSINLPLQDIGTIELNKEVPLFVYCYSGSRSERAVRYLKQNGYTGVRNIGGISGYRGKVER